VILVDTTASTEPNSTEPSSTGSKRGLGVWIGVGAFLLILTLLRTLPFNPRVIPIPEDDSWDMALNLFASRHDLCGKDYIFTFGPLGFVYGQTFFPLTFHLKVALQALLCSLTTLVLVMQGKCLLASPFRTSLWILGLIALYGFFADVFFLAAPILLVNQHFLIDDRKKPPSPESLILVFLLALTAIVKFTFFVAAAWTITFIAIDEIFVKRSKPILTITFAVVIVLAWLFSGQPIDTMATYILSSLPVTSGHSEAMTAYDTPNWLLAILASIASAAILFLGFGRLAYMRLGKRMMPALLAESGLFF
jgi:hypothetical protein